MAAAFKPLFRSAHPEPLCELRVTRGRHNDTCLTLISAVIPQEEEAMHSVAHLIWAEVLLHFYQPLAPFFTLIFQLLLVVLFGNNP